MGPIKRGPTVLPLHHNHQGSSSSSVFLFIVIGIPPHHRYSSSLSSVFLFIVIGHPLHHHHFFSVFFLHFHPLFIHLLIHFARQMPSKQAKYLPKIPFFMRDSKICLIVECLICGAYQQRNKRRKVGTFQIMP